MKNSYLDADIHTPIYTMHWHLERRKIVTKSKIVIEVLKFLLKTLTKVILVCDVVCDSPQRSRRLL